MPKGSRKPEPSIVLVKAAFLEAAQLTDEQRLCIVLSYQAGMSHAEIASLVDLPLGTVKSHIQRGTQNLQQLLSAYREH